MAASSAAVEEIEEFKVNASFRNGVLTMSVRAQRQAKRIAIYTGERGLSAEIAANAKGGRPMLQLEKRETIADVINLVLGAWLFLTPWIFGFVPNTAASWNAWLSGVAIGVIAVAALLAFAEWEEWINLLLGVWVAVSAWAVGFAVHATPTWVHVVTGIFVAVVAGVRLWFMHRTPPRVSA
jgi:SPW repeat